VDDGWGLAYMINENSIQFNVCSKGLGSVSLHSHASWTRTVLTGQQEKMSFYLNEAAGDIRDMMLPTLEAPKAKL
jgi:carnitine O-acetyltransferase